jgi:hypothetical protein
VGIAIALKTNKNPSVLMVAFRRGLTLPTYSIENRVYSEYVSRHFL